MVATTRRELLTALVGGSVAASACRRSRADVDSSFFDPSFRRGHAWRDEESAIVGSVVDRRARVVVLGAGVAGLSAAWTLRRAGVRDVVLLELESTPGGTSIGARTRLGGFPWGAHYLPAPRADQPRLIELLEQMKLVVDRDAAGEPRYAEGALVAMPRERIFADGQWRTGLRPRLAPGGAEAIRAFEDRMQGFARARGEDGRRAFGLPTSSSSEDERFTALDRMSFATWLKREGFDHPDVRWLAEYATRDDFGARPEATSAWFGVHYHAARMSPTGGRSPPFLTWPQGNFRLVEHLRVGATVLGGRLVQRARPHPSGDGVEVLALGPDGARERWSAERAVVALPSFLRRRVIEGVQRVEPELDTSAWLVANVHLGRRPGYDGVETAWDNVLRDSRSLGYVVSTHQLGPPTGPTTWTWYLPLVDQAPVEARRELLALDERSAADLVLADLEVAHRELRRSVTRVQMRRWGHAMPIPAPGVRTSRRLSAARAPQAGFHFAHTDLSGVALFEEAFDHGVRAGEEVARALGGAG